MTKHTHSMTELEERITKILGISSQTNHPCIVLHMPTSRLFLHGPKTTTKKCRCILKLLLITCYELIK